jgi:hypothetical protein
MLHRIRVEGIEAYCFGLIVDNETNQYAYYLSAAGHQTAVKGIFANFLKGESLAVTIGKKIHWFERLPGSYVMKIKKMPSQYCHGITVARMTGSQNGEEQSQEFLLITKDRGKLKDRFFGFLDAKTEVPLDPSWVDWLWRLFEEKEWSTRLKTLAGKNQGYLVNFQPGELISEISQAIELRAPEIVACMRPSLKTKTTGGSNGELKPENVS